MGQLSSRGSVRMVSKPQGRRSTGRILRENKNKPDEAFRRFGMYFSSPLNDSISPPGNLSQQASAKSLLRTGSVGEAVGKYF